MIHKSSRKLSTNKLTMLLVISVFTFLLVAGCTQEIQEEKSEESSTPEETNIQVVEAVLKQEFTGPDKEYIRLLEKDGQSKYKDMASYLNNKYNTYFTENGLDNFIKQTPAHGYHFPNADYQMSIEELEVKKSENINASNRYDFTAQVVIESSNEEKTLYEVFGTVLFSEVGKIGKTQIADKDGLLEDKLNELMNQ